jgi:tetratricopeptide (TPR) repeat protein
MRPSIEELIRLMDYMILLWLMASVSDKILLNSVITVIVIAGAIISFLGIIFLLFPGVQDFRMYSTFYQSDALAGYLLILLPLVICLSNGKVSFWPKVFLMVLSVIFLSCIFLTQSRGGWIAIIVVLLMLLAGLRKQGFGLVLFRLSFYIISAVIFVYFFPSVTSSNPMNAVIDRAGTIADLEHSSVTARFQFWAGAVKIAFENPVTGVGLGNFGRVYPRFQQNVLYFSHYTHNYYAQIAAETGIAGFIFFMLIICTILFWGFKLILKGELKWYEIDNRSFNSLLTDKVIDPFKLAGLKSLEYIEFKGEELVKKLGEMNFTQDEIEAILFYTEKNYYVTALGLFAGMFASMMHSFIDVDWNFPAIPQLFWIEAGMFFVFISSILPERKYNFLRKNRFIPSVTIVITVIFLSSSLFLYLCFWKGEMEEERARKFQEDGNSVETLSSLEKAIKWDPINPEYHRSRGKLVFFHYKSNSRQEYLNYAIRELEQSVSLDPYKAAYHSDLGHYYIEKYYLSNKEFLDKSMEQFKCAIENDPVNYPQFYTTLAQIYLVKGNKEEAEKILLKGANIMKNLKDINGLWSFRKDTFREQMIAANSSLADLYLTLKKFDPARTYYSRVLELSPDNSDALYSMALTFFSEDNYKKAEPYLFNFLGTSSLLNKNEILNWESLVKSLKEHKTPSINRIYMFLKPEMKKIIEHIDDGYIDQDSQLLLLDNLNDIIKRDDFYDKSTFIDLHIRGEGKKLIDTGLTDSSDIKRLNRIIFEHIYKIEIAQSRINEHPEIYYLLGICKSKEKNYREAKKYMELSLEFKRDFVPAYIELGQFYRDEGHIEPARRLWKQGLSIEPDNSVLKYLLGEK